MESAFSCFAISYESQKEDTFSRILMSVFPNHFMSSIGGAHQVVVQLPQCFVHPSHFLGCHSCCRTIIRSRCRFCSCCSEALSDQCRLQKEAQP